MICRTVIGFWLYRPRFGRRGHCGGAWLFYIDIPGVICHYLVSDKTVDQKV